MKIILVLFLSGFFVGGCSAGGQLLGGNARPWDEVSRACSMDGGRWDLLDGKVLVCKGQVNEMQFYACREGASDRYVIYPMLSGAAITCGKG